MTQRRIRKKQKSNLSQPIPTSQDNLLDLAKDISQLPQWQPEESQEETPKKEPTEKEKDKKIRKTFSRIEESLKIHLHQQTLKFLRHFLKTEYNLPSSSLNKTEAIELLIKKICFQISGDDNIQSATSEQLTSQASLIVETNLERFKDVPNDEQPNNVKKEKQPIIVEGFKNVATTGYKQNSRARQIQLVESFVKKYSENPPRGAQVEFSLSNNISPSNLNRYLQQHKRGTLTLEVERGHRAQLLLKDQIQEVIDRISDERRDKLQVNNNRIGEIITEVTNGEVKPSAFYISEFNRKFLYSRKIKTKMTKRQQSETPYENIYRTYYFYSLFASFMFRKFKVFDSDRIVVFDETGSNTKATETTKTPHKDDDGYVKSMKEDVKDTFLVAVKASGEPLPVSIAKSTPAKYSTINGKRVTEQIKVSGVHVSHIKEWLRDIYLPNSKEGDVLIWDNLSHHLNHDVQEILKKNKRFNILLPLGGHHQSPLDNMCFQYAKQLLSKWKKDHVQATRDQRNAAFIDIFRTLPKDVITNSFRKCLLDFWKFSNEEEYLLYVRKELKMNNTLYELYLKQFNRCSIDQFYILHPNEVITKVENEKSSEDMEDEVKDHPFIESDSLLEQFVQEQTEKMSSIFDKLHDGEEFNELIDANKKHLQVYVLANPFFKKEAFTYEVISSMDNDSKFMKANILDSFGIIFSKLSERYIQYIPSDFSFNFTSESKDRLLEFQKNIANVDITAKGFVIFPVSRNLHWYLLIYDCHAKNWNLFDSFSKDYECIEKTVSPLFNHFPDFIARPNNNIPKLLSTPVQRDGIHCGDFCVLFMELLSLGFSLREVCEFMEGFKTSMTRLIINYRRIISDRLMSNFKPITIQDTYKDDDSDCEELLSKDWKHHIKRVNK